MFVEWNRSSMKCRTIFPNSTQNVFWITSFSNEIFTAGLELLFCVLIFTNSSQNCFRITSFSNEVFSFSLELLLWVLIFSNSIQNFACITFFVNAILLSPNFCKSWSRLPNVSGTPRIYTSIYTLWEILIYLAGYQHSMLMMLTYMIIIRWWIHGSGTSSSHRCQSPMWRHKGGVAFAEASRRHLPFEMDTSNVFSHRIPLYVCIPRWFYGLFKLLVDAAIYSYTFCNALT